MLKIVKPKGSQFLLKFCHVYENNLIVINVNIKIKINRVLIICIIISYHFKSMFTKIICLEK